MNTFDEKTLNSKLYNGHTLLYEAVVANNEELLDKLLTKKGINLNPTVFHSYYPSLYVASFLNLTSVIT